MPAVRMGARRLTQMRDETFDRLAPAVEWYSNLTWRERAEICSPDESCAVKALFCSSIHVSAEETASAMGISIDRLTNLRYHALRKIKRAWTNRRDRAEVFATFSPRGKTT